MAQGNIIFLNGTSSSGKTSIVKALQEIMAGYYICTGIDHFLDAAPDKIRSSSDGINPSTYEGFCGCIQMAINAYPSCGQDQ